MRRTPWRAISVVVILGLALLSCDGPNRSTQPSSTSGYHLVVTASPNTLRGATPGTAEAQGGCAVVQVEVFHVNGSVVDGVAVTLTTTLGRFPASTSPARPEAVAVGGFTSRGVYTDILCAKAERGTAILTASVEDAFATTTITIF